MPKPAVILGDFTGRRVPQLRAAGWGRMKIDRKLRNRRGELTVERGEPWALDNGAFRMWTSGAGYDWTRFEGMLAELEAIALADPVMLPQFAVVPDRPAEGLDSLIASVEWLHEWMRREELAPMFRAAVPFYLAVQDGMTPADLEGECWECGEPIAEHFAGIFLGGSSAWKVATAGAWAEAARGWRIRFHYGRAGTIAKLQQAHAIGADSLDSAFPMWTAERWARFEAAWHALPAGPQLELALPSCACTHTHVR